MTHARPGATQGQAAFAFKLAREMTNNKEASYKPEGSRKELMKDPIFQLAFKQAKDRIAKMDARYVEESNQLRQCLLEIYVTFVLQTQYNDFDTH